MRHGKKINHLGRQYGHRQSMMSNMATSLIINKRINTTVAKAKALRKFVEPLLTRAKTDSTHSRRMVFSFLQDKDAITELFRDVAAKIADRPGGYTRILKTGNRLGDNAEMCMMELVDFNELLLGAKEAKKAKTTRRGRRKGTPVQGETAVAHATAEDVTIETAAEAAPETEAQPEEGTEKK